ncbi:MAG TPA: DUF4149 domain-containing protein [bacterium]|nr:DUF4149 domain-containing protein [bacterium]
MLLINTLYVVALVVWIGGIAFFSFIAAPSIFHNLPPEFAGKAVSSIFPKYYPLGYVSGLVAFACLAIAGFKTGSWSWAKMLIIAFMTFMTVTNSLITHPKARALKEEMQTTQSQTELVHLKEVFDRIHRWSVINNGIVLVLGLIVIVLTARNLIL